MSQRAVFSPGLWKTWRENLVAALGLGAAVVVLGCGGGGGGSGNPPPGSDACQDNPAPGATVICGYVLVDRTVNGVNGATVSVKTTAGTTLNSIRTYHNSATSKDGYYVLAIAKNGSTGTLLGVTTPASGYFTTYMNFGGFTYDISTTNRAGTGPCIPAIPTLATPGAGNIIPSVFLFPDSSAPPVPVFDCPRP